MNAPATTIERAAKERPILFSAPLVRAILDGRKTQTRRIAKFVPLDGANLDFSGLAADLYMQGRPDLGWTLYSRGGGGCWNQRAERLVSPYGMPGDRLWCREEHYRFGHWEPVPGVRTKTGRMKWRFVADTDEVRFEAPEQYRKGRHHKDPSTPAWHKRLARFMPRAFSRISLEVTEVRVERLQAISEADAQAEGCEGSKRYLGHGDFDEEFPSEVFAALWDSINGAGSWASNPWVWVVSFRRVEVQR